MIIINRKRTTHIRVYKSDVDDIKLKFPEVKMADMFHVSMKSNPFLQVEAVLRRPKRKNVKK